MPKLSELLREGHRVEVAQPWPRWIVPVSLWQAARAHLVQNELTLLDLWAEPGWMHMALLDEQTPRIAIASLDCASGHFPSIGAQHPPAIRLERAVQDLYGLVAEGALDRRPWLDHGRWGVTHPLGTMAPSPAPPRPPEPFAFLPVQGESLHQIAVGPVHAGIIEPGHFRFTANGETVVRLEQRLGYVHRGLAGLMRGASLAQAAKLAGRVSGDSTVAYALAFARAVEAALGVAVPTRAHWLRALMAELERLANHLGDIGAICNDASFSMMHTHCAILRELVLRAADGCFGHRLMRDCIVPGGVAGDLDAPGMAALAALVGQIRGRFPALIELYDRTTSLQDRTVATGILRPALARQFGAGGYVGRASGRAFDARRALAYAPYEMLHFEVPGRADGDVNARVWIRIGEVGQSLGMIEQILTELPAGALRAEFAPGAGEGAALVEGFRGDIWAWLRLDADGRIAQCRLRDPSWFQWPLLEAAVEGNIVADFPLCNKSFNCSYAGHDL